MDIHDKRDVLDVKNATVANSRFDDVDLSNTSFHTTNLTASKFETVLLRNAEVVDADLSGTVFVNVNMSNVKIENARLAGMTIDGVKVGDLFLAYEAAHDVGGGR